jgi:hypothetical protein
MLVPAPSRSTVADARVPRVPRCADGAQPRHQAPVRSGALRVGPLAGRNVVGPRTRAVRENSSMSPTESPKPTVPTKRARVPEPAALKDSRARAPDRASASGSGSGPPLAARATERDRGQAQARSGQGQEVQPEAVTHAAEGGTVDRRSRRHLRCGYPGAHMARRARPRPRGQRLRSTTPLRRPTPS